MLTKYNLKMPREIFSGEDALENLKTILLANGVKKAAVFTDKGIQSAGLLDFPMDRIRAAGVESVILDDLPPEPTYSQVQALADAYTASGADFIIAVGGGSVMDTAKLSSILSTGEYTMQDLLDTPSLGRKHVKTLMIPTTAGTGAEATPNAIVAVPEKELKVGIVSDAMIADNVLLDPLMIFGVGPFPRMEVAGAAAATVLAQAIVTAMFLLAARRETTLFPHIHPFRPSQGRAWLEMLRIGLPVSIQSMFFSSLSMFIARIVAGWGDAAIAAQKVGTQIESISYTTAEGFATAVNAFIAQNFGARRLDRICRGYWTAVGMIVAWSCFTTVMLVVFPAPLVRVFIQKEEVVRTGVSYLRIMGYSQILMCLEITSSGAFQGLGRPMPPTLAGVIGNAARIPMAILLSATVLGLDGVWWSISISSIAKGLVVFAWFVVVLHRCTRDGDLGVPRFIR